jgi:hypothetical protein
MLQPHDRPGTVDDDRAVAARAVQRCPIQDTELYRGHPAIKRRRERLPPGPVAPPDPDFPRAGLPEFGDNHTARCTMTTDNAEMDGLAHSLLLYRIDSSNCTRKAPRAHQFIEISTPFRGATISSADRLAPLADSRGLRASFGSTEAAKDVSARVVWIDRNVGRSPCAARPDGPNHVRSMLAPGLQPTGTGRGAARRPRGRAWPPIGSSSNGCRDGEGMGRSRPLRKRAGRRSWHWSSR